MLTQVSNRIGRLFPQLALVMCACGCAPLAPIPSDETAPDETASDVASHDTDAQIPVHAAAGPFWSAPGLTPAQRFELAKRSRPELIAFVRRMPKGADLHNHLAGATYADFLLESALALGKHYDLTRDVFVDSASEHTVTVQTLIETPKYLSQFRDIVSMRGWHRGSANGRDHFFRTFSHFLSAGRSGGQMLAEVLTRNHYQNVQYLELMAMPRSEEAIGAFVDAFGGLDVNDLEASFAPFDALTRDPRINAQLKAAIDGWEQKAHAIVRAGGGDPGHHPVVRYIGSLDRQGSLDRFFIAAAVLMTAVRADDRVVAINILAPEDATTSRLQFDSHMRILDFLWRRLGEPAMTLHSGELSLRESPVEPMIDRIRRSIDEGHASRIGHGVSIAWERDLVSLLRQMRDDGVLVEINLSSNDGILGVSGYDHPFELYRSAGVPMCLCTDDEGVNRSNLTMEYVKAVQAFDLAYEDLKQLARNCLEYSFLPGQSLFVDRDYTARRKPPANSAKAQVQASLESAFDAFEHALGTGFAEDQ